MKTSGLHAALQLAVDDLRMLALQGALCLKRKRLDAASTLRDFLGKKRRWSRESMRSKRQARKRRPRRKT